MLTWGETPRDLDSHLRANNVHLYYSQKWSTHAWLDIDITSSYGPETITIENLAALGGFNYMIHDYTNAGSSTSSAMSNSGAVVRVYKGSELVRTYHVPTGNTGTVWYVFSMSANGTITDHNTFGFESSASQVGAGMPLPTNDMVLASISATAMFSGSIAPDTLKDYEIAEIIEQRLFMYGHLIEEAKAIDTSLYSVESAEALVLSLGNVEKLLNDPYATEDDLAETINELLRIIDGLVFSRESLVWEQAA